MMTIVIIAMFSIVAFVLFPRLWLAALVVFLVGRVSGSW